MKIGILLVANRNSQVLCENLVFSIRKSGCRLPIRLIHYGGEEIFSAFLKKEVEFFPLSGFPEEAHQFIGELQKLLVCPLGYLRRFFAFFSDWDAFLYSDNDIVALSDWSELFNHLDGYDLIHADLEGTSAGRFNYRKPAKIEAEFGPGALESAFTAGHFVCRVRPELIQDLRLGMAWFRENPETPIFHDQALLHVASLIGRWKILNLCSPPHSWLSSWAGDYDNPLCLIQKTQAECGRRISHLHYSGYPRQLHRPICDLLTSNRSPTNRSLIYMVDLFAYLTGFRWLQEFNKKIRRRLPWPGQRK